MNRQTQHIALSGFMGVGKTTMAKRVSQELSWSCYDLDEAIEHRLGMAIHEIFDTKGEAFFREEEHKTLLLLMESHPEAHVLSLGGGSLLLNESRVAVQKKYQVFSLILPYSIIEERVANSERPLKRQLKRLYDSRQAHYESVGQPIYLHDENPEEALMVFMRHWNASA